MTSSEGAREGGGRQTRQEGPFGGPTGGARAGGPSGGLRWPQVGPMWVGPSRRASVGVGRTSSKGGPVGLHGGGGGLGARGHLGHREHVGKGPLGWRWGRGGWRKAAGVLSTAGGGEGGSGPVGAYRTRRGGPWVAMEPWGPSGSHEHFCRSLVAPWGLEGPHNTL